MSDRHLVAAHSFPVWLPQTQTWMYNQVQYLPPWVEPHIFCERVENLDQFGMPNIHAPYKVTRIKSFADKWIRRAGVRPYTGYHAERGRQIGVDVVHSHFGDVAWMDLGLVRRIGARHVVTFYGLDVNLLPVQKPVWRKRYRKLFKAVDAVLCEGPHMAKCVGELGCPDDKLRVQRLGIDLDQIPFRPRHWGQDEPLRVLIAAAFREKKGIPYALEALANLASEVPLEITLIGDANRTRSSQAEKRAIMSVIEGRGLLDKVRLLGYQPHSVLLEEAYLHHIFLSPSVTASDGDTEGGAPVSIIEMAASGMPVVATRHCDIPEVIAPGNREMFLAEERDVDGLADCIRAIMSAENAWSEITSRGRKYIEEKYDAAEQSRILAEIYADCCR